MVIMITVTLIKQLNRYEIGGLSYFSRLKMIFSVSLAHLSEFLPDSQNRAC